MIALPFAKPVKEVGFKQSVYFLFNGDSLVYVGASYYPPERVAVHSKRVHFDRALAIPVDGDRAFLESVERQLIKSLRPSHNIAYNDFPQVTRSITWQMQFVKIKVVCFDYEDLTATDDSPKWTCLRDLAKAGAK